VPLEERRALLEHDILNHRGIELRNKTKDLARAATKIEVERSAVELMEKVLAEKAPP
jgi:hypothetical protein